MSLDYKYCSTCKKNFFTDRDRCSRCGELLEETEKKNSYKRITDV